MSGKAGWRELDASANEALTRFFNRTGWEPVYSDLPFDEMIAAENSAPEESSTDAPIGEYELRERIAGVKGFFEFMRARGAHPAAMLKQLAAAGRACHEKPFHAMTMGELGLMFGETKSAHSWRCKLLSREIELTDMEGSTLPGQKSKDASKSYRAARTGKKKTRRRGKKGKSPIFKKNSNLTNPFNQ